MCDYTYIFFPLLSRVIAGSAILVSYFSIYNATAASRLVAKPEAGRFLLMMGFGIQNHSRDADPQPLDH